MELSANPSAPSDPVLLSVQVRESAMTIVPSVKLEDLPVVVKFILHNIKAADAVEVQYFLSTEDQWIGRSNTCFNKGKLLDATLCKRCLL